MLSQPRNKGLDGRDELWMQTRSGAPGIKLPPSLSALQPPKVKCLTRIWHPNITETGEICLR